MSVMSLSVFSRRWAWSAASVMSGPSRLKPVAIRASRVVRGTPRRRRAARVTKRSYGLSALNDADDVVAVAPGVGPDLVELVAVGVGVAGEVEPVPAPALAVVRRREQPVDHLLVGVGRLVVEERVDLLRRRRQAGQVEGDAADECSRVAGGAGVSRRLPASRGRRRRWGSRASRRRRPAPSAGRAASTPSGPPARPPGRGVRQRMQPDDEGESRVGIVGSGEGGAVSTVSPSGPVPSTGWAM